MSQLILDRSNKEGLGSSDGKNVRGLYDLIRPYIPLLAIGLIATLCIVRGITIGEFDFNYDEPDHAATGFFFHDLLLDHPVTHPVEYTYLYYAHYPALGLIHWPPFFHFCEGIMFLLFTPSVVTARVTVLLFALLGLYFWFKFVCESQDPRTGDPSTGNSSIGNEWIGALAALFLALAPGVLLYEKVVMLEVPSLALCIAATYFWSRYLRTEESKAAYWFGICAALALMTKQNTIYLAPFCLFTIIGFGKWRLLLKRPTIIAVAICLLLSGPFYVLAFRLHGGTITKDVMNASVSQMNRFTYYFVTLPDQLGWPLLVLSILGIVTYRLWDKDKNTKFMMLWIAASYLTLTIVGVKATRYAIYWIPPFIYFAVAPLSALRGRLRVGAWIVMAGLLATTIVSSWRYERPYISGYAASARRITEMSKSGFILFDGDLPANFIFFVRRYDAGHHFFVLRKALYTGQIMAQYGKVELLHSEQDLNDLIARYGIRFVVVSEKTPLAFPVQATLRKLLDSSQFRLVDNFPVDTNERAWTGDNLLLYENLHPVKPSGNSLTIKMMTLPHDITVPVE
jgi:Dolichyl-phosphate-mannose-protein mannosyltransferase